MRIEILSSVMISGEPVEAGSFVEVSNADANLLVNMNKAQLAPEPEPVLDPEPEPEAPKRTRKPAPAPSSEVES